MASSCVGTLGYLGGPPLFFVISGFLIVTLLIRERERKGRTSACSATSTPGGRSGSSRSTTCMIYRSSAVLALAISPGGSRTSGRVSTVGLPDPADLHAGLSSGCRWGRSVPCWSLAMEEQFYLFWPTVERFAARPRLTVALARGPARPEPRRWRSVLLGLARSFGLRRHATALRQPMFVITFTPIDLGVRSPTCSTTGGRSMAALPGDRLVGGRRFGAETGDAVRDLRGLAGRSPRVVRPATSMAWSWTFAMLLGSLVVREDHVRPPHPGPRAVLGRLGVISYGIYLYHVWVIAAVLDGGSPPAPAGVDRRGRPCSSRDGGDRRRGRGLSYRARSSGLLLRCSSQRFQG